MTLAADNTYGNPETDALRRDLTINGLFYDLGSYSVLDYVGGIKDLQAGVVRIIGNPGQRLMEDPVRMIRAVRHAARTGFVIEPATYQAIVENARLITVCPQARLQEEFSRELKGGFALASFGVMKATGLLGHLLPLAANSAESSEGEEAWSRVERALNLIDQAVQNGIEMKTSVALLAVVIGNLAKGSIPAKALRDDVRLKQLVPAEEEPTEDAAVEEESADEAAPDSGERRSSPIRRTLTQMFQRLGVSRADRENMEMLLTLRHYMLQPELKQKRINAILARPECEDALRLLFFTAHDNRVLERLDVWQTRFELFGAEESGIEEQAPRRRRRRRGPRRRRPAQT